MNDNRTVLEAQRIQKILAQFKQDMKKWEHEEIEFREYCEGIIGVAYCGLGLITGQYK